MTKQSDLWQFANDFYAAPDVAKQLLALQNNYQVNVNYLIYALWLSTFNYQLRSLPAADDGAGVWRSEIALPLRTLRFSLRSAKNNMQGIPETVEACYQKMLTAELAAERVELDFLEADIKKYAQPNVEKHAVDKLIAINVAVCCSDAELFPKSEELQLALEKYIQLAINYMEY